MPKVYAAIPEEGPRVTRAFSHLTRDDAGYRPLPDHNEAGLFVGGPQEAKPITARLSALLRARSSEPPEGALGALQRMHRQRQERLAVLERRERFLETIGRRSRIT
jgi:hypothetical protein